MPFLQLTEDMGHYATRTVLCFHAQDHLIYKTGEDMKGWKKKKKTVPVSSIKNT
jgi:hypothetical protein